LRVLDFGGLPPSLPFARDEAAFRFDLTEPRHAGQKHTRSIRWIGHFGIRLPPDVEMISDYSLACSDKSDQLAAICLPTAEAIFPEQNLFHTAIMVVEHLWKIQQMSQSS
jgi:hypothetical protein